MVYIFLADGFEELEALSPVDVLRRAGIPVTTVGVGARTVTGSHGIPVTCDTTAGEAAPFGEMEMIILPGGMPGTTNLENSPIVQGALDQAAETGAWICAICAAPSVLGHKGLLRGKQAVCFPGFEEPLEGAALSGELMRLPGVGPATARLLWDHFGSVEAMAGAGEEELRALPGVGRARAAALREKLRRLTGAGGA